MSNSYSEISENCALLDINLYETKRVKIIGHLYLEDALASEDPNLG